MAVPVSGVPTGGLVGAAANALSPIQTALADVGKAFAKVAETVKTAIPLLDTFTEHLKRLGDSIKDTFRTYIGGPILEGLKSIGRGIKWALPTDVLDNLKATGGKAFEAVGAVATAFGSVAVAAPVIGAAFGVLGTALSALVQAANPAVVQQFQLALRDTMAVVGQGLAPVLQVVTQAMRMFGDALAVFSKDIGGGLATILQSLLPIFQVFLEVFAAVGEVVGEVMKLVAPLIKMVADGIRTIFEWMGKAVRWILGLIGVDIGDSKIKAGASTGAAVRQASVTSVSDVVRQAQISAMQLGNTSGVNYAEVTADNTGKLVEQIFKLLDQIQNLPRLIGESIKTTLNPFSPESRSVFNPGGAGVGGTGLIGPMTNGPSTPKAGSIGVPGGGLLGSMARRRRDGGGTVQP